MLARPDPNLLLATLLTWLPLSSVHHAYLSWIECSPSLILLPFAFHFPDEIRADRMQAIAHAMPHPQPCIAPAGMSLSLMRFWSLFVSKIWYDAVMSSYFIAMIVLLIVLVIKHQYLMRHSCPAPLQFGYSVGPFNLPTQNPTSLLSLHLSLVNWIGTWSWLLGWAECIVSSNNLQRNWIPEVIVWYVSCISPMKK